MLTFGFAEQRAVSGFLEYINTEIVPCVRPSELATPDENMEASLKKSRLQEKMREICPHVYPDGQSAWVSGADSQCAICRARD